MTLTPQRPLKATFTAAWDDEHGWSIIEFDGPVELDDHEAALRRSRGRDAEPAAIEALHPDEGEQNA